MNIVIWLNAVCLFLSLGESLLHGFNREVAYE